MSVEGSVRDRRRAETVHEIKAAALAQLAEGGTGALSLRGVARAVGMTVQSLYHYFDSRDALLTALVVDSHRELAVAVREAVEASVGKPTTDRRLAATEAFRNWALANRSKFLLLYGTPVPGFEAVRQEDIGDASRGLAPPFYEVVFEGWTTEELAAIPLAEPHLERESNWGTGIALPSGALALMIEQRARMHGMVMLELLGHLDPLNDVADLLFRAAMVRMSNDTDVLHEQVQASLASRK